MSVPEVSHVPADRERQLAEVVNLIIETNVMDTLLESYRASLELPGLHSVPRTHRLVRLPGNIGQTLPAEIRQKRDGINRDLKRLGGIPCLYTDRDTLQEKSSVFIAWHGPVQGNPELHWWSPRHRPLRPITVSADYLEALRDRYPS